MDRCLQSGCKEVCSKCEEGDKDMINHTHIASRCPCKKNTQAKPRQGKREAPAPVKVSPPQGGPLVCEPAGDDHSEFIGHSFSSRSGEIFTITRFDTGSRLFEVQSFGGLWVDVSFDDIKHEILQAHMTRVESEPAVAPVVAPVVAQGACITLSPAVDAAYTEQFASECCDLTDRDLVLKVRLQYA